MLAEFCDPWLRARPSEALAPTQGHRRGKWQIESQSCYAGLANMPVDIVINKNRFYPGVAKEI